MSIFSNILSWVEKLFTNASNEVKKYVPVAINVVQVLKTLIDNPVADSLAALVGASSIDAKLKTIITEVLLELELLEGVNTASNQDQINAAIQTFVASIPGLSTATQGRIYSSIAALLLQELANDGSLSFGQAVSIIEGYYETGGLPTPTPTAAG